ncbi:hypothetical protein BRC97_08395 [Halobacteriales archaeon QS_6_71_20]|nr:MAG: hypothetical protein BRC97_08395 [Halobacteriales archaeon QS_6_71_20]
MRIGLRVLHDAVQSRIVEQYRRARDPKRPNHLLVDDDASAWFAFADLRVEAHDGVPDGPYDPEADRLFVPTTDQLAAVREGSGASDADGFGPVAGAGDAGSDLDPAADTDAAGERATGRDDPADAEPNADSALDPNPDPDPDGLADIDPADLRAGEVDAADLPEYAVQRADPPDIDADPDPDPIDGDADADGAG